MNINDEKYMNSKSFGFDIETTILDFDCNNKEYVKKIKSFKNPIRYG